MKKPKISIIIIHYNTPQYLKTCLDSIFKQTYKNIEVIFIDNDSPSDDGLKYVEAHYSDRDNLIIVPNEDNLGYAKAANQGIDMAIKRKDPADYVVITNPDIIYSPSYFEKIVHRMEKDRHIASATGKVLKYDFENKRATDIIDTVGLIAYKSRRIADDGQGLKDNSAFDKEKEVFGVSGACPIYRREALEDAKIFGEYLDNDFFMYKEDVDLSWRLLLFGWKSLYFPKAIAFHGRGTGIHKRFTTREIFKHRGKLSKFQKHYSFRNQYLMQWKNEMPGTFLRHFIPIMFRLIAMPFYITITEPYLWKAYLEHLKLLSGTLKKRKEIMKRTKISAREMAKNFKCKSGYLN